MFMVTMHSRYEDDYDVNVKLVQSKEDAKAHFDKLKSDILTKEWPALYEARCTQREFDEMSEEEQEKIDVILDETESELVVQLADCYEYCQVWICLKMEELKPPKR